MIPFLYFKGGKFDIILEKPVKVELEKSIGRGDNVCHFIVVQSSI
jgi:hypothetical protein